MNKPRLLTQAEFAVHRGVGRSAVSNWKRAGLLVLAEADDGQLKVDVARTEARLNRKIDPTRGRPTKRQAEAAPALPLGPTPAEPTGPNLAEVRSDLLTEQVIAKRLENARKAGELVPAEDFERRATEYGRLIRERVHSAVRTLSERLAVERDPRAIIALLSEELDRGFAELADQVAGGQLNGGEDDEGDLDDEAVDDAVAAEDAAEAARDDEAAEARA